MKKKNPLYIEFPYYVDKVIKSSDFDEEDKPLNGRVRSQISYTLPDYFGDEDFFEAYYTQGFRICRTTKSKK
jgi:hypothetical protein